MLDQSVSLVHMSLMLSIPFRQFPPDDFKRRSKPAGYPSRPLHTEMNMTAPRLRPSPSIRACIAVR